MSAVLHFVLCSVFDEYLAVCWVIRQCGTGWIDIQYQLLSGHKSQYHNCDIVMESSTAEHLLLMRLSQLIRSRVEACMLHDLKTKTHLTEGHLVLPVLMAEGDHHLKGRVYRCCSTLASPSYKEN